MPKVLCPISVYQCQKQPASIPNLDGQWLIDTHIYGLLYIHTHTDIYKHLPTHTHIHTHILKHVSEYTKVISTPKKTDVELLIISLINVGTHRILMSF